MILTTHDNQNKTISSKFSGDISIDEIMDYFHQLGTYNYLPKKLLYFEDHTEAVYTFKAAEVKKLMRILNICIKQFDSIKAAIVQNKPKETAYSIIALQHINDVKVNASVFSTHEAAKEWLLGEEVSAKLSELREGTKVLK